MAGIVVIFDFDKTIIECDSDNWVVDEMEATDLFNELRPTMPWNSLMDQMMKELYDQGKIGDIIEVLKRTPIQLRVVPAIKAAYSLGCDLRIVSDANTFFIETILENLGLRDCFSEIHTNPGFVDERGRLRISSFHDFHNCSPTACTGLFPPNMCMDRLLIKAEVREWSDGEELEIILLDIIGKISTQNSSVDALLLRNDVMGRELECRFTQPCL